MIPASHEATYQATQSMPVQGIRLDGNNPPIYQAQPVGSYQNQQSSMQYQTHPPVVPVYVARPIDQPVHNQSYAPAPSGPYIFSGVQAPPNAYGHTSYHSYGNNQPTMQYVQVPPVQNQQVMHRGGNGYEDRKMQDRLERERRQAEEATFCTLLFGCCATLACFSICGEALGL